MSVTYSFDCIVENSCDISNDNKFEHVNQKYVEMKNKYIDNLESEKRLH
jgi:hypothetical protein